LAIFAALATIFFFIWLKTDWQMLKDEQKGRNYKPTARMTEIAEELQLTRKGRAVFNAAQPTLQTNLAFNQKCGRDGGGTYTLGCYFEDNGEHINIYDNGLDKLESNTISYDFRTQRAVTTLHETLHAVYARLDDQDEICAELKTVVPNYPQMQSELSLYDESQYCTEAFARVGSEHADALSNTQLARTYREYFTPNTELITKYAQNETQLAELNAAMNSSRQTLVAEKTRVDSLVASKSRYANSAIANYNQLVSAHNALAKELRTIYNNLDSERVASL
jgi:hypothetical protein